MAGGEELSLGGLSIPAAPEEWAGFAQPAVARNLWEGVLPKDEHGVGNMQAVSSPEFLVIVFITGR